MRSSRRSRDHVPARIAPVWGVSAANRWAVRNGACHGRAGDGPRPGGRLRRPLTEQGRARPRWTARSEPACPPRSPITSPHRVPCHASRSRRPLTERGRARRCFPSLLAAGRAMPCFPAGSYHALQWDQGWSHCSATLNGTAPCGEARHGPAGRTQEAAPDRRDRGRNPVIRSKCARADIQRRFAACSEAWHGPAARPRPTAPRTSRTESESK